MGTQADEILTINELSVYLKIPKSTLYKLAREGKVPSQRIGRHWRFRKQAIDRWMEEVPVLTLEQTSRSTNSLDSGGSE